MTRRHHRWTALAVGCILLLAACQDRHEPTKPTVAAAAAAPAPLR